MVMRARSLRTWAQDYSIDVLPSPQARDKECAQRKESKFNLRRASSRSAKSRESTTPNAVATAAQRFEVGDNVQTRQGMTRWHFAEVRRYNPEDNTYDVRLDTGDFQFAVSPEKLRRCCSREKTEAFVQALTVCARGYFDEFSGVEQRAILSHLAQLNAVLVGSGKPRLKKPPPPPPGKPPSAEVERERPPPQGRPKVLGKPPRAHKEDDTEVSPVLTTDAEVKNGKPPPQGRPTALGKPPPTRKPAKNVGEETEATGKEAKRDKHPPQGRPTALGKPPPAREPEATVDASKSESPSNRRGSICVRPRESSIASWARFEVDFACSAAAPGTPYYLSGASRACFPFIAMPRPGTDAAWQVLVRTPARQENGPGESDLMLRLRVGSHAGPIIARAVPGAKGVKDVLPTTHIICADIDGDRLRAYSRSISQSGACVTYCKLFDDCCRQAMRAAGAVVVLLTALSESDMHLSQQVNFALREFREKLFVWTESDIPSCALAIKLRASLSRDNFEDVAVIPGLAAAFSALDLLSRLDESVLLLVLPEITVPVTYSSSEVGSLVAQADEVRQLRLGLGTSSEAQNEEDIECSVICLQKSAPFAKSAAPRRRRMSRRAFREIVVPAQRALLALLQAVDQSDDASASGAHFSARRCGWPGCDALAPSEAVLLGQLCLFDVTAEVQKPAAETFDVRGLSDIQHSWARSAAADRLSLMLRAAASQLGAAEEFA